MAAKLHAMGAGNFGPRGGKILEFHCPGCGYAHPFETDAPNNAGWQWNGSMDKPTFTPSLLVWATRPEMRCHSFVTDGRIQFLSDCHHELRGQTVDLPDWDNSSF